MTTLSLFPDIFIFILAGFFLWYMVAFIKFCVGSRISSSCIAMDSLGKTGFWIRVRVHHQGKEVVEFSRGLVDPVPLAEAEETLRKMIEEAKEHLEKYKALKRMAH